MDGSVYIFGRTLNRDEQSFKQTITIFATSEASARDILTKELHAIRELSRDSEFAYGSDPSWKIQEVKLDAEKVLTEVVTG